MTERKKPAPRVNIEKLAEELAAAAEAAAAKAERDAFEKEITESNLHPDLKKVLLQEVH
jgi:hypothetical protein